MTRNKKISLFLIGVATLLSFSNGVKAASASLTCEDTTIQVGGSTLCTVTITTDTATKDASITLETSEYLDISNIKAASSAGWAVDSQSGGVYKFKALNTTSGVVAGKSQLFSFNLKLNERAKNLSADESCGQLCISKVSITDMDGESDVAPLQTGSGNCFSPTVEACEGSGCNAPAKNPETGEFMNYAIIGVTAMIALIAILIARRGNKFYTM